MQRIGWTRGWATRTSLVAALLAMVAALFGPVAPTGATDAPARAAAPLKVSAVKLGCECGGAGYIWGWNAVVVEFSGARKDHTYKVTVKGGPTVAATAYGRSGFGYINRDQGGFEVGETYRFTVKEFRGKRLTRSTPARAFTIPEPVGAPARAHIDTITRDDQEVMIAGETYRITFDGEWEDGIAFASGVDRYFGVDDERFGWYQEEGYPLPWRTQGSAPIVEFTPTEEFIGTRWNIPIVGYRVATRTDKATGLKKGRPVPGSEWGFNFSAVVVAS